MNMNMFSANPVSSMYDMRQMGYGFNPSGMGMYGGYGGMYGGMGGGFQNPYGYNPYASMGYNPFMGMGGIQSFGPQDFASYYRDLMGQYFPEQLPQEQAPQEKAPQQETPQEQAPATPAPFQYSAGFGSKALQSGGGFGVKGYQQLAKSGTVNNKQQANQLLKDFRTANAGKSVTSQDLANYASTWKPAPVTYAIPAATASTVVKAGAKRMV